jgi:multidrug transporter EmrE-like cation transporter
MDVALFELILASVFYAVGGLCMKLSMGLSKPLPTAMLFALFLIGATLQTLGMRREDLGVAYIMVLGLEAVAALALSVFVLEEACPPSRLIAVGLIIGGIIWLRNS